MNVYEANETMKLLGHQPYIGTITEEQRKGLDNIIVANLKAEKRDLSMIKYDLFMWGYIHGIRAERRRRKSKQV